MMKTIWRMRLISWRDIFRFFKILWVTIKKVINTKLSAVSSYYLWAMKRGIIEKHPFDRKLDRMRQANDERLISHYFLTDEQVDKVTKVIHEDYKKN